MPPVAPFGNEPPSPPVQTQSFENSGDYIQSEQPRLDPVEKIGTGGEPASAITSAGAWDRQKAGTPQDWYPRFIAATQVPMVGEPEDKYVKMPETPDFKKWFGDSKVVFKKGESDLYHNPEGIPGIPRMVYHGSVPGRGPGLFHPDEQRGAIILSSSPDWVLNYSGKEAEPIPAYIKIANPLVIKSTSDSPFLPAAAIDEAKAQGRDGIIFDRRFGKYDYAVFSPDQIKSPFNRGIFDLGDSGILNEADRAYDEKSGEIPAPVTTLAISFKEIDEKPVEIIDMPIEGHAVLALLAQQWRNPKYEELRYVYVKQGIIVDHEGITCRLPTVSKAFIGDRLEGIKRLKERIAALGADSLWLVHNHPSGNPDASGEDLNLTVSIGMEIPELQGHVIINSGNYAFIDPKGECDKLFRLPNLPQKWIDPILTAPISHSVLGEQLKTHKDIAKWAKILTSERNKPLLVYLSAVFKVRGLQEINPGGYRDWKQLADVMPKKLVDFGSKCAVLILPERSYGYDFEIGESLVRRGVFYDVVAVSEYGAHSLKKMGVRVEDQKSFGGRPLSDFPPQYIR
ncbi:hypothetical protein SBDP1_1350011 [Syntrophobacter sp. SbD1]|nr:hypothetical protein SBDP1_1350011 [Syntrophobacter sp. SbD1]